MSVIRVRALTKVYRRGHVGISGLDLAVEPGEVFGFLGPNGAGKTTTLRCLMGLIKPTSGGAEIFGRDPWRDAGIRREIGYLPGELAPYENMGRRLGQLGPKTGQVRPDLRSHSQRQHRPDRHSPPVPSLARRLVLEELLGPCRVDWAAGPEKVGLCPQDARLDRCKAGVTR
jgi:energy-coupling factor transporter ATP-binding protein EcfA2